MTPSDRSATLPSTPGTGAPANGRLTSTDPVWSSREYVIVNILEQYADLTEPGAKLGIAGDDGAHPHLPHTYTDSVKEIERLMRQLQAERRSQWWHVNARYLAATSSTKTKHRLHGRWTDLEPHEAVMGFPAGWTLVLDEERGKRKQTPTEHRVYVVSWNPNVRAEKVRRGVRHLADNWSLTRGPVAPMWERRAA